jgi:hypothetical protein
MPAILRCVGLKFRLLEWYSMELLVAHVFSVADTSKPTCGFLPHEITSKPSSGYKAKDNQSCQII